MSGHRVWRPVAIVLSILNAGGLIMAVAAGEPMHALGHIVAAVLLARWLRRMRERDGAARLESPSQIEALEAEVDGLRRELTEAQERLDFAERMMAQRPATPRTGLER